MVARVADGVIVGSAVVRAMDGARREAVRRAAAFVRKLRAAVG
jgi:tryptophan synthase alpha subunit